MLVNAGARNNQIDQVELLNSVNQAVRSRISDDPELFDKWRRIFSHVTFVGYPIDFSAFAEYISSGNILDTIESNYIQNKAESIRLFAVKNNEGLGTFFSTCNGAKRVLMVFLPITPA